MSADGFDFSVTGVDAGGGPYKIAYRPLPESERIPERKGPQWEVTITVPADAPEGMLNHRIIDQDHGRQGHRGAHQRHRSGAADRPDHPRPGQPRARQVGRPGGQQRAARQQPPGQPSSKITETAVDNQNFKVEVIPLQAGQRFQIAISLQVGAPKGEQKATLRITTNDPLRKVIEVPGHRPGRVDANIPCA